MNKTIRVRELSGLDIGKTATITPSPGFTISDEIRAVVHGTTFASPVAVEPISVWVRFKNVIPARAIEMGAPGDGFRFNEDDMVEVQD